MNFIENIVENQSSTIKEYEEDYEKSIDNQLKRLKKFKKVLHSKST